VELAARCISENLSVRQVEEAAKQAATPKMAKAVKAHKAAAASILPELEEEFQQALGTRVRIIKQGLGGHIEIEFYGDEDITRIYELIVKP
jgi:ParB family chromosome partitioning protein